MRIRFEDGLYELCERRIRRDKAFQDKLGLKPESSIRVDEKLFQEYRLHRLQETVCRTYSDSRAYRKKFDEVGVKPEDIRSMEDIRKLPFTKPEDLQGDAMDYLCISQRYVEKPVSYYSSGTIGIKKRIFFSNQDVSDIMDYIGMAMHSLTDEDARVLSLMVNSLGRGASYLYCKSIERVGMQGFPADMEAAAEETIKLSIENKCNVWFGDVFCIYRIAKTYENRINLRELGLRLIYITMGNISHHVKNYLEEVFGCKVMTHYGLTEAGWGFAPDNDETEGYVYNELDVITEIVDIETGELITDGREGEICLTIIGREAMPIIRYRTGDISAWLEPLDGRRGVLKHIVRRLEGCVESKGTLIYPAKLEDMIFAFPETVDYAVCTDRRKLYLTIETVFSELEIESTKGKAFGRKLSESLLNNEEIVKSGLDVEIKLLPIGALQSRCFEKKRMVLI